MPLRQPRPATAGPAVLLVIVTLLAAGTPLLYAEGRGPGQQPATDQERWDALQGHPAGALVRIYDAAGRELAGRLKGVSAQEIEIETPSGRLTVPRESVERVERLQPGSRARGAKVGLLIGAAGGALVGATLVRSNQLAWGALLAGGWGALGAGIGAAAASERHRYVLIYKRP